MEDGQTLADAKQWLRERFEDGADCPCCGQFVKLYKRPLGAGMASSLIAVYRWFLRNPGEEWMDVTAELKKLGISAANSNTALLRHWGLLEQMMGTRDDGSKRLGRYKVTDLGVSFIRNQVSVPKYIYQYNDEILQRKDADPTRVTIVDALGKKFNYTEMMRGTPDDSQGDMP